MEKSKILKIIQLTDTHLLRDESLVLKVNTNLAFKKIMNKIQHDLCDTDAIFLTGDISQDESIESYQLIVEAFKKVNKPIFWIPGNHDSINTMQAAFCKQKNFFRTTKFSTSSWDFIFLNTKNYGTECGLLSDSELSLLNSELMEINSKFIALVMHHHPIEVNTPLIDNYILKNKDKFWDIVNQNNVNLIICGHVHGDYSLRKGTICIETSPASCFQFRKGSMELDIDNRIGYKLYYFSSNSYVTKTRLWKN